MINDVLWQQVAAFRLDDGQSALSFSQRLARENGWSPGFSRRVTEEYKRFVYLAACAGHPVTPSDQVDQVWHLHLVYTRSYWEDLCRDVLGMPLHHGPTRGGRQESDKFTDWYQRTLASYRREFGADAPPDIWPPTSARFSAKTRFQRVDVGDAWVISRSRVKKSVALTAGMLLLTMVLAACDWSGEISPPAFVVVGWLVIVAIASVANSNRNKPRRKRRRSDSGFTDGGSWSSSSSSCGSGCGSDHDGPSGCCADSGSSGCGSSCGGGGCGGGGGD